VFHGEEQSSALMAKKDAPHSSDSDDADSSESDQSTVADSTKPRRRRRRLRPSPPAEAVFGTSRRAPKERVSFKDLIAELEEPETPGMPKMYKVVKKYVDDALRREQEMTVVKGAFRGFKSGKELAHLLSVFLEADTDHNSSLDVPKLASAIRDRNISMGKKTSYKDTMELARRLMNKWDLDRSNSMEFDEFVQMVCCDSDGAAIVPWEMDKSKLPHLIMLVNSDPEFIRNIADTVCQLAKESESLDVESLQKIANAVCEEIVI